MKQICKGSPREIGMGYIELEDLQNEEVRYLAHKHWAFRKKTEPYLC